jgi:hypothetical protein
MNLLVGLENQNQIKFNKKLKEVSKNLEPPKMTGKNPRLETKKPKGNPPKA